METIGYVLITDEKYLHYSLFTASSIKVCSPNVKRILILMNCLDQKDKLLVIARELKLTLIFTEETIEFSRISQELIKLNVLKKRHVTNTTYLKLSLIPYFANQFDRIVYLDIDLLLIGDIDELCEFDLMGYPMGAVKDFRSSHLAKNIQVRRYFNAGLLVFDLTHPVIDSLGEILLFQLQKSNTLRYQDQDVLNIVFDRKWFEIPDRYNYQIAFRYPKVNHNLESVRIFHFVGPLKPWKVRLGKYHQIWESEYRNFQSAHESLMPEITSKKASFALKVLARASTTPLSNMLPISIRMVLANFLSKKFWWK
jgi:lipopolysaccharide biosynthesis glycosyltransferase